MLILLNNLIVYILQIEGAFVQGLGFFMLEEYETNLDGLVLQDGTWNYKIPTIDTIPKQFNVQILNSGHHQQRVLSSKGMIKELPKTCLRIGLVYLNFPHEYTSLIHEKESFVILFHWFIIGLLFQQYNSKIYRW